MVRSAAKILIEFTIAGITYYMEEDMTWGDWIDSEYNTDNLVISSGGFVSNGKSELYQCVKAYETINFNISYSFNPSSIGCFAGDY